MGEAGIVGFVARNAHECMVKGSATFVVVIELSFEVLLIDWYLFVWRCVVGIYLRDVMVLHYRVVDVHGTVFLMERCVLG